MIKRLTILSLFILILPFFQTCSDETILENSFLKNGPLPEEVTLMKPDIAEGEEINKSENEKEFHYTLKELNEIKQKVINQFLSQKKEFTKNGFQLGFLFIEQLEVNDLLNSIDYGLMPFFITIIITGLLIFYSFKRKFKIIIALSISNLLILIIQLFSVYNAGLLEDIEQIKIGYYLFLINLILISWEAFKEIKKSKTES